MKYKNLSERKKRVPTRNLSILFWISAVSMIGCIGFGTQTCCQGSELAHLRSENSRLKSQSLQDLATAAYATDQVATIRSTISVDKETPMERYWADIQEAVDKSFGLSPDASDAEVLANVEKSFGADAEPIPPDIP